MSPGNRPISRGCSRVAPRGRTRDRPVCEIGAGRIARRHDRRSSGRRSLLSRADGAARGTGARWRENERPTPFAIDATRRVTSRSVRRVEGFPQNGLRRRKTGPLRPDPAVGGIGFASRPVARAVSVRRNAPAREVGDRRTRSAKTCCGGFRRTARCARSSSFVRVRLGRSSSGLVRSRVRRSRIRRRDRRRRPVGTAVSPAPPSRGQHKPANAISKLPTSARRSADRTGGRFSRISVGWYLVARPVSAGSNGDADGTSVSSVGTVRESGRTGGDRRTTETRSGGSRPTRFRSRPRFLRRRYR